ncbi:MAG: hypothetical protein WDZ46_09925 [Solirubrobacterales bacterium]
MRSRPVATAGVLLSLALTLAACGEGGAAAPEAERATTGAGTTGAATGTAPSSGSEGRPERLEGKASAQARAGAAAAESKRCGRVLGEFLDSMESLGNSVAVGVDYEGYLDSLNRVRATYAEVDADRLAFVCLGRVAAPAERSLNVHIEAANSWGDCLAAGSCNPGSIEANLQRKWEQAANQLGEATGGLQVAGGDVPRR